MKLPDLDPTGGPLEVDHVLLDYDGPQLFSARNRGGSLFLALHGPLLHGQDAWLFARTTRPRFNQLQNGVVSLRDVITLHARGSVALVTYHRDEPKFQFLSPEDIPEEFLPDEDSFFQTAETLPATQSGRYLALDDSSDSLLPILVEQDLWEFDANTIQYLKDHMTPLHVVARRRQRLVADIVLSDYNHKTDIPIPDLGKILISLQKTVDSLGAQDLGMDWKPSAGSRRETRLDAIASFPSSFGLRIEANQGSLADVGAGPIAFQRLVDLLSSISDPEVLKGAFRLHSSSTKLHFGRFIESIAKTNSAIKVTSSSGLSTSTSKAYVTSEQVSQLAESIREINESEFDIRSVRGRLKAVSLRTKFFLIENEDESISGRISDDIVPRVSGMVIDDSYLATIKTTLYVHDVTGEIETKKELIDFRKTQS